MSKQRAGQVELRDNSDAGETWRARVPARRFWFRDPEFGANRKTARGDARLQASPIIPSMKVLHLSSLSRLIASNGGLLISTGSGSHPERKLTSYELILVRSGTLHLQEDKEQFHLSAGDTLLLWPGKRHGPLQPYDRDTAFYWVHFQLGPARAAVQFPLVGICQQVRLTEPARLIELFHRFLDDQENARLNANYSSALLKLMLFEIGLQAEASSRLPSARNLAAAAQTLLTQRCVEDITTSRVAKMLKCNPDYLGRVYRQMYGQSLTDGIHRVRMARAKSLLLLGSLNINEVAAQCGYSDPDYFRRVFRRHFDMSPRRFRSLHVRQHLNTV